MNERETPLERALLYLMVFGHGSAVIGVVLGLIWVITRVVEALGVVITGVK